MTTISTRRHPIKFYTVLIFVFLFLTAFGSLFLLASFDLLRQENPETKNYFLPVFSLAFYLLAFSVVYTYWKNSPKITVDKHTITFGDRTFYLKDIRDIALTGKMPFRFIIRFPVEGTALIFNDGTEKFFFDDMYSNSWEIKSFLEQSVIKKVEYIPSQTIKVNVNAVRNETEYIFKGNQFTSLRGILLWGLIGFFIFLMISKMKSPPIGFSVFTVVFGTTWFLLNSWFMNYFVLTKDYLIVRNHNFLWQAKIYCIKDIKEIVYETQSKQPNSMRVITIDFRNKLYPAGTLRNKTWLEMKNRFEAKGVKVRNECIPEE